MAMAETGGRRKRALQVLLSVVLSGLSVSSTTNPAKTQKLSRFSPPGLGWGVGLLEPVAFVETMNRERIAAMVRNDRGWDFCDPSDDYLSLRRWRSSIKYGYAVSPAFRLLGLRRLVDVEEVVASCPPPSTHEKYQAKNKMKKERLLRFVLAANVFHWLLLSADLYLHGKVVLTPAEVMRYAFVQSKAPEDRPKKNRGFLEESELARLLEKYGRSEKEPSLDPESDAALIREQNQPLILRGGHRAEHLVGRHFEESDDDPARDREMADLRAKDPVVDSQLRAHEMELQKRIGFRMRTAGGTASDTSEAEVDVGRSAISFSSDGSASGPREANGTKTILKRTHLSWLFYDRTEAEIIHILEHLEAFDELLPSHGLTSMEELEETTTFAGTTTSATAAPPGYQRLPAKVFHQRVEWRPKVRATVEIPYTAYPVVPPAARQRHWLTLPLPLVTGLELDSAGTTEAKPIVQFLRLVNTRASRKTELVKLLLHHLRAVLSKRDFERIVDPEERPYLKWFLTVKHPHGAPDEYLRELRELDDWRRGCVWACGSAAVLLLFLALGAGAWALRLFRKNEAIRRRMWAARRGTSTDTTEQADADGPGGDVLAPSTASSRPQADAGERKTGGLIAGRRTTRNFQHIHTHDTNGGTPGAASSMARTDTRHTERTVTGTSTPTPIFGRRAPPNTSASFFADTHTSDTETGTSTPIAPPNTSVSSYQSGHFIA